MKPLISVVIRTLNEEKYLEELLFSISNQSKNKYRVEVVIVDSGSTDQTLSIAKKYNSLLTFIKKEDFSFGKSLNVGCNFSNGDYLVFVSGHCIPVHNNWLENLVSPLEDNCGYTYGKQIGRDTTKFSENQLFEKYFPDQSKLPQSGFFCNNANAAIRRDLWSKYKFNELLTGCEDMELAKRLTENGISIGYVSEAPVFHIHDETWEQVKIRYERESLALQQIMPEIYVTRFDVIKFVFVGIVKDAIAAFKKKKLYKSFYSIIRFRLAQYLGAYHGNHLSRKVSKEMKEKYFYPRVTKMDLGSSIKKEK